MKSKTSSTCAWLTFVVVVCVAFTISMSAQVKTEKTTIAGKATVVTQVESGEITYVSGNNVIVKMADGSLRHFENVPDSVKITVDGQQLGVRDLRVGMKVQRTITTTTVPKTIKTVQTVTGTVWNVNPPSSVILTLADGTNQQFKIPNNQKFNVDGQMKDAWGLRKGMKISATKVVEVPQVLVAQQRSVTGEMPPPPPTPPADQPILIVIEEVPAPPVQVAQAAPAELPKTGSQLPLIGLLGFLSLALSFGLRTARKVS